MRKGRSIQRLRLAALVSVGALVCALAVSAQPIATPVYALEDLPTWDDVQKAKKNEASAAEKVREIEGLLEEGERELERLRNLHTTAIEAFQVAEQAFLAAAEKAQTLEDQAAESSEEAEQAADQAAVVVAQMYRSGGIDRSVELFLEEDGDTTDALLDRLALMSKATERNTEISEAAERTMNNAESLGQQAEEAADERERLRAEAEEAEQAAAVAVDTQADEVRKQEEQQVVLETQLEALKDTTTDTVAGYKERLRLEEEARKKAAEEAARRAAEAAAAAAAAANSGGGGGGGGGGSSSGGGGGGGGGGSTSTGSSGWVNPVAGKYYISAGFRPPARPNHTGIDMAAGCGTPVVAPKSGTVAFSGWYDSMGGNMVYLNQGNGYQTRFAHLNGWPPVRYGQSVSAGQVIGYVGTTGASTGCHLHYEVRPNHGMGWDSFINPWPYL